MYSFKRAWLLPLSNAQWKRHYRAKKLTEEGDEFLRKDSQRIKSYYKKVSDMTPKDHISKENQ